MIATNRKDFILLTFIATFLLLNSAVLAVTGPVAELEERVYSDYNPDGTVDTQEDFCGWIPDNQNPCRYGALRVSLPNNNDVLQDLRINLSSTNHTNLTKSLSYKGALSSYPNAWDMMKTHFNDSADNDLADNDEYYHIYNQTAAPEIQLSFHYENKAGGEDIYDEDNQREYVSGSITRNDMTFTVSMENPSSTQTLSDASANITFQKGTGPNGEDLINIYSTSTSTSSADSSTDGIASTDENGNGIAETIKWNGTLASGDTVNITIQGYTEGGVNFPEDSNWEDLDGDDKGTKSIANIGQTLTGITMDGLFSRGPIRQGTDLSESSQGWRARGFINNMASGLTYDVSSWSLWNVSDDGSLDTKVKAGLFNRDAEANSILPDDGRVYTTSQDRSNDTEWYSTQSSQKPYFAAKFDWQVVWNETNTKRHFSKIESTMDLPIIHKIDMVNEKSVDGVLDPDTSLQTLNITDNVTHVGSEQAPAEVVNINSRVPGTNTDGTTDTLESSNDTYFEINETSNVSVYYQNSTGTYEIPSGQGYYTVETIQPTSDGSDGLVNVTIPDTSTVPTINGNGFMSNESVISIKYQVFSNTSMTAGDAFEFAGNTSLITDTGTPINEQHATETVSVSAKRLTGWKQLEGESPSTPTLIDGTIEVSVTDTEGGGVHEIKFMDYVPQGTDFPQQDNPTTYVDVGGDVSNYYINYTGLVTLPSGVQAHAYEYMKNNTGGGWSLYNGEKVNVSYQMNITDSGLYEMPMTLVGVDPATGNELGTRSVGVVRVDVPEPLKELEIDQNELKQVENPTVGSSGEWLKRFQVYNPNSRPAEGEFETKIFKDAEKAWISYTDQEGDRETIEGSIVEKSGHSYIKWKDRVPSLTNRNYQIRVITPPVAEVNRDVEVLEQISNQRVRLKMDISVRNFADEDYKELMMNLPIPQDNVEEITDGYGNELRFTGSEDSTTVYMDEIKGESLKTVSITYKQPYPTIIVTPERDTYQTGESINISVLVINGGEEIDYPKIETEIYGPGMQVVDTKVGELESLDPMEETRLTERYEISTNLPAGEYMANVRFREDFQTLASGTGQFYVESSFGPGGNTIPALILLIATAGLGYLSFKRLKELRGE